MVWAEVKINVAGCYDCDVRPEVIVEALCLSKSSDHFISLILGALDLQNTIEVFAFGGAEENS